MKQPAHRLPILGYSFANNTAVSVGQRIRFIWKGEEFSGIVAELNPEVGGEYPAPWYDDYAECDEQYDYRVTDITWVTYGGSFPDDLYIYEGHTLKLT